MKRNDLFFVHEGMNSITKPEKEYNRSGLLKKGFKEVYYLHQLKDYISGTTQLAIDWIPNHKIIKTIKIQQPKLAFVNQWSYCTIEFTNGDNIVRKCFVASVPLYNEDVQDLVLAVPVWVKFLYSEQIYKILDEIFCKQKLYEQNLMYIIIDYARPHYPELEF